MIEPLGVTRNSLVTSLGTLVYYSPTGAPWLDDSQDGNPQEDLAQRPTLVFLHGFGGGSSAYEWSKVYPAFAGDYRVLAPDLLGWGRSDHPERNYTPQDYIQTIQEFLRHTCPTPPIVIASSLVAAIAVRAAIESPELFAGLILSTPTGLSDFGEDYRSNFFAQLISVPILDRFIYSTGIANSAGIMNFLEKRQFAQASRIYPEIIDAYLASANQPNAEYAALSFVRGDLCFDLAQFIPQLTVPSTILWGEYAQFTPPAIGRRLAALNPTAIKAFVELKDVGLTPHLELPGVTIGVLRKFLALFQNVAR
ncbi:MAG: alpha/beta hydrolase [Synechocystis sp.]|nr:alpha/beta hydrolase [Synechocystis sp.]